MTRHIANLTFGAWKWRIYLAWNDDSSGDGEFAAAMKEIESIVGPAASKADDFLREAQQTFRRHGFDIFKG